MSQRGLKAEIRDLADEREAIARVLTAYDEVIVDLIEAGLPSTADGLGKRREDLEARGRALADEISALREDVRGPWSPAWLR